jgi:hypothetical protein
VAGVLHLREGMKRLLLALLLGLGVALVGCTDDGDASQAPVLEDGNQVPGEQ